MKACRDCKHWEAWTSHNYWGNCTYLPQQASDFNVTGDDEEASSNIETAGEFYCANWEEKESE